MRSPWKPLQQVGLVEEGRMVVAERGPEHALGGRATSNTFRHLLYCLVLLLLLWVITLDFDRRRRIRICCDELNLLVPFCNAETDKATTLQWTTAFLKYIQERHGDSLKKVSIRSR